MWLGEAHVYLLTVQVSLVRVVYVLSLVIEEVMIYCKFILAYISFPFVS